MGPRWNPAGRFQWRKEGQGSERAFRREVETKFSGLCDNVVTIDELRTRKRELLARKKYELDLQAAGRGDNLALFMVNEELMDVNAQLRALSPNRRVGARRVSSAWAADQRQYEEWRQEETALDEEISEGRALMRRSAERGMEKLPPRQREMMKLLQSGLSQEEIAGTLGVNKSTVSRTLARAKRNVRRETERTCAAARLRAGTVNVDLTDPLAAKTVLSALTPKQAVYFYLYFSEWLNLREIGVLVGKDHTVILRALRRALRNIGTALGGRETVLENPEALDELAYQIYCDMAAHPERLPEEVPGPITYTARHPPKSRWSDPPSSSPPASLRDLVVRVLGRPHGKKPPGKLLTALRRERSAYSLFHCLAELFRRLKETFK